MKMREKNMTDYQDDANSLELVKDPSQDRFQHVGDCVDTHKISWI